MKDRKLFFGLSVLILLAGGCIMEPYEEIETETVDSVSSEVSAMPVGNSAIEQGSGSSTTLTGSSTTPQPLTGTVSDPKNSEPAKPQPDPWDNTSWHSVTTNPR